MSPSPSPEVPADEPQPTIPQQQRPNSPLFQEPSPSPDQGPQSSPSSTPSPSGSPSDLDPSEDPTWSTPAPADQPPAAAGSGDTPSAGDLRITRAAIAKSLTVVLDNVTHQLSRMLANDVEKQYGLWLAADDEIKAIAEPASRIAHRNLPDGATSNSELLDIVGLGIALGGYVLRNLTLRRKIRTSIQLGAVDDQASPAPA